MHVTHHEVSTQEMPNYS